MATPGRTHIPWETQDGQVAELISYISFLEAKLQYLQYHHEHCNLVSPTLDPNLPYLPPDFVVESDEAERATLSTLPLTPPSPLSPTPAPAISAPVQQVVVKKGGVPRWKRIIDQMMIGWEQPNSWEDRRVSIGLDTVERNRYALTMILGQKASLTQAEPMEYFPNTSEPPSATESLIASARQYALETKAAQKNAGSIPQINTFRELVFASLCVVMEQQGLPIDTINELMRICMSSSGPANLYRLRRGALWVNRVIAGTLEAKLGWEYNATEFFLLSGRPVSQYGLLWEACVHSFPYLCQRLEQVNETVAFPPGQEGWIPFSVPLIVKGLVGEALTLQQICVALDYDIRRCK